MYESPIDVIYGEMQTQIEGDIYKAIHKVGVNVNKDELLKALQYDREQYSKGYKDGYNKAINDFAERLQDNVESFQTEINGFRADVLTLDYFVELIDEIAEQLKGYNKYERDII